MSGTPSDLVEWFKTEYPKHRGTFLFYYRGNWWPPCTAFIEQIVQVYNDELKKCGDIQVVGVCAQPVDKVNWF